MLAVVAMIILGIGLWMFRMDQTHQSRWKNARSQVVIEHRIRTMKRSHIIAIVIIAVAIGALVGSLYDSSTYADLDQALADPGKEYHVVGVLGPLGRRSSTNPA